MRYARMALLCAVVVVMCLGTSWATKVERREFTSPMDGTEFEGLALVSTDKFGGVDSDFCTWPKGSSGLPYEVQVCPNTFYAARNKMFNRRMAEATKEKMKSALDRWRKKHPEVRTVKDLTPGQRWELVAMCDMVRGNRPHVIGKWWIRAAWATRHAALKKLKTKFGDPMSAFEMVEEMIGELAEEKNEAKLVEKTFQVIMGLQRSGDAKRRDKFVAKLAKKKLDDDQKKKLESLKKNFAAEAVYLQHAIDSFNKALEDETVKDEQRGQYTYRIADMTRRLGKKKEAIELYRKTLKAGKLRKDIRVMAEHIINWLTLE